MTSEELSILAEKTVALLLSANRSIQFLCRDTKAGGWDRMMFHELSYGTVAICGRPVLARMIEEKLSGFGCKVILADAADAPSVSDADYLINLDNGLAIDNAFFDKVKPGMIIVDAAGVPFDKTAVISALKSGKAAGFATAYAAAGTDAELEACKNYAAFPELGEEMRD